MPGSPKQMLAALRPQTAPASTAVAGTESPERLSPTTPENKSAPFKTLLAALPSVTSSENKSVPANPLLAALTQLPHNSKDLFTWLCAWVTRYAIDNGYSRTNKQGKLALTGKYADMKIIFRNCRDDLSVTNQVACVEMLKSGKYDAELVSLGIDKTKLINKINGFDIIHVAIPKP